MVEGTAEILVKGGTIEDAANILGDDPATISENYTQWSVAYQNRTVEILRRVHATYLLHEDNLSGSDLFITDRLVPEVGLEPTHG